MTARLTTEQAHARIATFKGTRETSLAAAAFTRDAVRDSLHAAPQPVSLAWVQYALSCVGQLTVRSEQQGLPLDRTVVLDRARIDRFLAHDCTHLTVKSRASYRSKLDIVAAALLGGQNASPWPRAVLWADDTTVPWDDEQAARVALWTSGLRPRARRDRVRALLALSLGAGLRRRDMGVGARHVVRDASGVHVTATVPPGVFDVSVDAAAGRTVTVAAGWEQEVLLAADRAGDGLLIAPGRASLSQSNITASVAMANRQAPEGDELTLTRARATWLVRHLAAGTPLPLLMAQAGVSTPSVLTSLLPHVPATGPAAAAAFMRGAQR